MPPRGVYRGVYANLVDDPDFQQLSSDARHVLLTIRLSPDIGPAGIFRYYVEPIAHRTGLTVKRVESALEELEKPKDGEELGWIMREGVIIWVVNALRHDPTMHLSDEKHLKSVHKAIACLPHQKLVLTFCDYYKIPRAFEGPSKGLTKKDSNVPPISDSDIRSPSPTPNISRPLEGANGHSPEDVLIWLNQKAGRNYRPIPANLDLIRCRLKEGILPEQLKAIVSRKVKEWGSDEHMRHYLRPATLFNRTKCEQYLGELPKPPEVPHADPMPGV